MPPSCRVVRVGFLFWGSIMPDEPRPGVSGASSPGAQSTGVNVSGAGSPSAPNQPGTGTAAGATDPTATGGNQPGPIPYERFHQVNDEKNRAVAQAAALEAYARQLTAAYQDLQSRANAQPAQPAIPAADPLEQVVSTRLGNDETGQAARETIAAVVQLELKKALKGNTGSGVSKDEIMQIVNGVVAQALAPNAINTQLQQWKSEGRISEADIPVVSAEMQEMITAQPAWGQGENVRLLPIVALGNAVAKGKLKPSSSASPAPPGPSGTPLQPGGPSSPVQDNGDALRVAEAVVSKFPKLAKIDPQALAKRYRDNPLDPYHGETVIGTRR